MTDWADQDIAARLDGSGPLDDAAVRRAADAQGFDATALRSEIRRFCTERLPSDIALMASHHRYFDREQRVRWQRLLSDRGWLVAHWPRAFGGQDWGHLQRLILIEELERAGTPWITHFGASFIGPVLIAFGSPEQQRRFLPGVINSDTWWAQGFSEPGAGSDLGSLATRAESVAGGYRVNGQKAWTTMAQWADMMFCLVRTAQTERRSDGISMLLIDLRSPGVTVRPIETFDSCHHVNEVFLEDVFVPADHRVGTEGQGWAMARFIVERERLLVTEIGRAHRFLCALHAQAAQVRECGRPVSSQDGFRRRAAALEVRYHTLRATVYAASVAADQGHHHPVDASLLKIRGSELQKDILDLTVEVMGREGLSYAPAGLFGDVADGVRGGPHASGLVFEALHSRATSIYGGSNEIQRGIIAKALLRI